MLDATSRSRKIFQICNVCLLMIVALMCILPFVHLLAVSLSSNAAANAGAVGLWPVGFVTDAYKYLAQEIKFITALFVSVKRVVIGGLINMTFVILTAYPLSKDTSRFKFRTVYAWFFVFTMFFGGGLIPTYIVIKNTGLLDSIWALVIPGALNIWNMVMLLNFFRGVPKDLEEAAIIDGAGVLTILWKVYLPVSVPALATILLFTLVGHWNAWFDGILYMNAPDRYPLQSYLYTLIQQFNNKQSLSLEDLESLKNVSQTTLRTAQIFMGVLPILLVYPFLQKFFVKGIVVGSVKG